MPSPEESSVQSRMFRPDMGSALSTRNTGMRVRHGAHKRVPWLNHTPRFGSLDLDDPPARSPSFGMETLRFRVGWLYTKANPNHDPQSFPHLYPD